MHARLGRFRADAGGIGTHGIPLLMFEFDMLDPRVKPRDDVEVIFRNFIEDIVLPKKAARA